MVSIGRPNTGVLCPVNLTGASSQHVFSLDRGTNGSIHGGSLFKPHGQLKLTLLAICIDIATL